MDTFVYRDRFDTKHLRLKINQYFMFGRFLINWGFDQIFFIDMKRFLTVTI